MGREAIAALIPHQGAMCLLDQLHACSPEQIECSAHSHRDPGNPLRTPGGLLAVNGVEYAAQAMALHGAMLAGEADVQRPGYLASVRGVTCHVDRLDDLPGALQVRAHRLAGDASQILYTFELRDALTQALLVDGRATVVLNQPLLSASSLAASNRNSA